MKTTGKRIFVFFISITVAMGCLAGCSNNTSETATVIKVWSGDTHSKAGLTKAVMHSLTIPYNNHPLFGVYSARGIRGFPLTRCALGTKHVACR